jgi:hypothetical protein
VRDTVGALVGDSVCKNALRGRAKVTSGARGGSARSRRRCTSIVKGKATVGRCARYPHRHSLTHSHTHTNKKDTFAGSNGTRREGNERSAAHENGSTKVSTAITLTAPTQSALSERSNFCTALSHTSRTAYNNNARAPRV